MFKKAFTVLAGTMVAAAVCAAGAAQLRSGHPDAYTVHKGDTLWGISAKFLAKPWLWPEIWQANPQVRNPHLIYPGDVLNLSFINGGPGLRLAPAVHHDGDAVPAIPLAALQTFLKDLRVMDSSAVSKLPYVVGLEEARLRGTPGQSLYARGLDAQPGQKLLVVRPEHVFRGYDEGDDDRAIFGDELNANAAMVKSPWEEDFRDSPHYRRGKDLGVEVKVIGTAEVLRGGDPSTLLLLDSTQEVRSGDRLIPVDDTAYDPYYYPHAPKALPKGGRVIAFAGAMDAVGPHQVVALSVGKNDGVDNGTTFAVWQPNDKVHDDVASNSWDRGVGKTVQLPDEYIGHVMVFRTFDHVSYALVMDGLRPVKKGDALKLPDVE